MSKGLVQYLENYLQTSEMGKGNANFVMDVCGDSAFWTKWTTEF